MKRPRLAELQQDLTSRVNELRCLQRLIESKSFAGAYDEANDEDRGIVHRYIKEANRAAVEQWVAIQERDKLQIEELPVRELRKLASSLRIQDYNYLTRASLLSEIQKVKGHRNDVSGSHEQDRATPQRDAGHHPCSGSPGDAVQQDRGSGCTNGDTRRNV